MVPRGSVLLVVLVVIAMLTLATYTFCDRMLQHRRGAWVYGRQLQAEQLAASGGELVKQFLSQQQEDIDYAGGVYDNPGVFGSTLVLDDGVAAGRGRFAVVAPRAEDDTVGGVRFGLEDEAARINVNSLLDMEKKKKGSGQAMLLALPGMTEDIADAILDWIDDDDDPREYGAEGIDYTYPIANAPLQSLDELLMVSGVTPAILYGEDTNRNGLLDANENDADASAPFYDNADGILDHGLTSYLTVHGTESNVRADGTEKIYLNEDVLSDLFDTVEEELGETEAQFIAAFRIYGSMDAIAALESGDVSEETEAAVKNIATGIAGSPDGTVTRAGLDLLQTPQYPINSIFDLIDAEVDCEVDGQPTTLTSPWTSADMVNSLPDLYDMFTSNEDPVLVGRIDPNHARAEVLLTIPVEEMTENLAESIAGSSMVGGDGLPLTDLMVQRATPGWLLIEGLVDLPTMRILAPHLTTRGSVFRCQTIGYFGEGGPVTRLEVVIDATSVPSTILSVRDLTELGNGYSRNYLQQSGQNQ
jgi:hypothetical protein